MKEVCTMSVASKDVFALFEKAYRLGAMEKGNKILGEALENAVGQGISMIDLLSVMDENATEENLAKAERLVDTYGWAFKLLSNDTLIRLGGWVLSFEVVRRKGVQLLTKAMVHAVRGEA